jgi:YD repeat-containing protein
MSERRPSHRRLAPERYAPRPRAPIALGVLVAAAAAVLPASAAAPEATGLPSEDVLDWDAVPGAVGYNVYRGEVTSLQTSYGECLLGSVQGTTAQVPDDPVVGEGYFYLLSYFDGNGEEGLGAGSGGAPRVPDVPCKPARRFFPLTPNGPSAEGLEEGREPRRNPPTHSYVLNDIEAGVYTHSGELFLHQVFGVIPGRGMAWAHENHYRSQIEYDGPFGFNWDSELNARLVQEGANVRFHDGTGRSEVFMAGAGSFVSPPGLFAVLVANPDGSHTLRWPDGLLEDFHAFDDSNLQGALLRRTDPAGNTLTFQYDRQGLLTSTTDTLGRAVEFEYDAAGRLTSSTDVAGRSWSYAYDAAGNLISTTSPPVTGTPHGNDFPAGKRTEFQWSSGFSDEKQNRNLLALIRPREADSDIPALQVTYELDPSTMQPVDRVAQMTVGGTNDTGVPAGGTTSFSYASLPPGPDPTDPDTPRWITTIVDRAGNQETHQHNLYGNRLRREEFTNRNVRPTEPASYVTEYRYDDEGNLLLVQPPEGDQVLFTYDTASPNRGSHGNVLERRLVADTLTGGGRGDGHGGEAADIVDTWTWEPLYNRPLSHTGPRGNDPTYVPQNGGPVSPARYTTTLRYVWQEGDPATSGIDDLAARFGIVLGGVNVAMGDVNGDGVTDQTFDAPARIFSPAVTLEPGSSQALIEGDTQQEAETLFRWNDLGQLLATVDPESNVHLRTYHPEEDPDGDGTPSPPPPDGRTLDATTGGYLAGLTTDVATDPLRNNKTNPPPAAILTTFQYDQVGNLTHVVDGRGVLLRAVFNQLDQLVQARRAAATATAGGPGGDPLTGRGEPGLPAPGFLLQLSYDANDNLIRRSVEDRDGDRAVGPFVETDYAYDILGNRIRTVQEATTAKDLTTLYAYDANENLSEITEPEGNSHTALYDERDLLFQSSRGAAGPRGGAPSTTTYDYDANGNLVHVTDARGNEHDVLRDGFNRAVEHKDTIGNIKRWFHDPASNVVRLEYLGHTAGPTPADRSGSGNQLLRESDFLYDEAGRLFRRDRALFPAPGSSSVRPPELAEGGLVPGDGAVNTLYEYDKLNRLTFIRRDSLAQTRYDLDGVGRLAKRTLPDGSTVEYTYDAAHNLIETAETELSSTSMVAPELFLTTHFYDALGRRTSTVDNLGQTAHFEHDSLDALRAGADPNGPLTGTIHRRSPGRTGITVPVNGPGNVSRTTYDGAGRRLSVERILTATGMGDGTFNPPADTTNPVNPDGRITALQAWDDNSLPLSRTDDNGNTTAYTYDNLNRLTQVTEDDGTSRTWVYDGEHNPVQHVDANGSVQTRTYDAANRLTQIGVVRAAGIEGTTLQLFQYDGLDRLTRSYDDNDPLLSIDDAVCEIVYDSLDRVLEERQTHLALGGTRVVDQAWEAEARRVKLTYPSGRQIQTTYDAADRVDQVSDLDPLRTESASFDWFGMAFAHTRTYGNGVRSTTLDDAGVLDIGRDGVRRVTRYRHLLGASTLLAGFEHDYDRNSNRLGETRQHHIDPTFGFPVGERWSFDSANRLVEAVEGPLDPGPVPPTPVVVTDSQNWLLDGRSNWVQMTRNGVVFDFTPNNLNEYDELQSGGTRVDDGLPDDAFVDMVGGTGLNHGHDKNGNLTDEGLYTLVYDFMNRPVRVVRNADSAPVGVYRYLADGRRIFREVTNRGALNETRRYSWEPLYAGASAGVGREGDLIVIRGSGFDP